MINLYVHTNHSLDGTLDINDVLYIIWDIFTHFSQNNETQAKKY